METRPGWGGGGGVGGENPREFNTSVCICPTQGHSLQVTFPCCPGGLPAKEAATLRRQPTAPPRPSPAGRSPFPASLLGPKRASRHLFPTPGPSLSPIPRLLRLYPRGSHHRPLPPSGRPFPGLPRPVPPAAWDGVPFFPSRRPLLGCPPGAARPRPVSSASGRLPSPPGPAPLPGGYSLKPLRISLARSSLVDMMRGPPPAALPRWPGGAS